jgi:hypothetical protein
MTLPKNLFNKYIARFDELINLGEAISKLMVLVPSYDYLNSYVLENNANFQTLEKWKINCISLLNQCLPKDGIHQELINKLRRIEESDKYTLEICISSLKAIKEDFEQGFLGDLALQIESEIAADYMGQAEQLLAEGTTGKYDHVPAAVLSGAVLEKALRTLCDKQTPPISTIKNNGESKTLNPLIEDLKKANVFNEPKAKQLKSWADIRNKAAHGEFEEFKRDDVELMIKGIKNFLADYMT